MEMMFESDAISYEYQTFKGIPGSTAWFESDAISYEYQTMIYLI